MLVVVCFGGFSDYLVVCFCLLSLLFWLCCVLLFVYLVILFDLLVCLVLFLYGMWFLAEFGVWCFSTLVLFYCSVVKVGFGVVRLFASCVFCCLVCLFIVGFAVVWFRCLLRLVVLCWLLVSC